MASEWEKLEKLSKDELIIELVKARWEKRNLQKVLLDLAGNMGSYSLFAEGGVPSKEWQEKIAKYVFIDDNYHNLQEWGVDEETSDRLYDLHYDEDGTRRKTDGSD
ncbi:MAG: hypothetical protein MJZ38_00520 [archaeon]|nr:hypothetical protein [archaeon]